MATLALVIVIRFGPMAVSYAIIPPERGYYRYYRTGFPAMYWEYLVPQNGLLVSTDFRTSWSSENWELEREPGASGSYWRRDYRGEFDGAVTFSRTAMVMRDADGRDERYDRVLDLWEIWNEKWHVSGSAGGQESISARRQTYNATIEARRIAQGLTEAPSVHARGPTEQKPSPQVDLSASPPLISVREYRGLHTVEYPLFALYADGTMIWLLPEKGPPRTFRTRTATGASQTLQEIAPFDETQFDKLYQLSNATDQTVTILWIAGKEIEIYGPWRKARERQSETGSAFYEGDLAANDAERRMWETLPPALHAALTRIDTLRTSEGQPWLPEWIEVQFSTYEHALETSILWPADWPGLYHPTSRKHGADFYSVFVPSVDFNRLLEFLATQKPRGAVMIDLNQMSPEIRFPFPGESAWRN